MLSPSERVTLEKITEETEGEDQKSEESLSLDAIMFFNANQWTFWLNQKTVNPTSVPNHIQVHWVTQNQVCLSLKGKKQKIILSPNEKYIETLD